MSIVVDFHMVLKLSSNTLSYIELSSPNVWKLDIHSNSIKHAYVPMLTCSIRSQNLRMFVLNSIDSIISIWLSDFQNRYISFVCILKNDWSETTTPIPIVPKIEKKVSKKNLVGEDFNWKISTFEHLFLD